MQAQHFDMNNPGDDYFFLTSPEEDMAMFSWRAKATAQLDQNQMRAVGRVVVLGMTDNAQGEQVLGPEGQPRSWLVEDERLGDMADSVSRNLSTIMRRKVVTYWTHFYTHNVQTGATRDNIIMMFYPRLMFEGVPVTFTFDRPVATEDVPSIGELLESDDGGAA